jgi:hypothetical protein
LPRQNEEINEPAGRFAIPQREQPALGQFASIAIGLVDTFRFSLDLPIPEIGFSGVFVMESN